MSANLIEHDSVSTSEPRKAKKSYWIGWLALIISLAALISGAMPHFLFGDPLPNPLHQPPDPKPEPKPNKFVLIEVNGDKLAAKIDDAQEVAQHVGQQAAGARDRAVRWAAGIKRRIPGFGGAGPDDGDGVADALQPENRENPPIDAPLVQPVAIPNDAAIPDPGNLNPQAVEAPWKVSRNFLLMAVILAIASLPIAMASWLYEQQRALPVAAVCCGTLAVTWQYLLVGIVVGLTAAVFIYVLAKLAQNFG